MPYYISATSFIIKFEIVRGNIKANMEKACIAIDIILAFNV